MPHLIVEYTSNLKAEGDIPGLLRKCNRVLMDQGGVFPTGAIRSRAIELTQWCMADGEDDYEQEDEVLTTVRHDSRAQE